MRVKQPYKGAAKVEIERGSRDQRDGSTLIDNREIGREKKKGKKTRYKREKDINQKTVQTGMINSQKRQDSNIREERQTVDSAENNRAEKGESEGERDNTRSNGQKRK